jgi:hypothetical protein
VLKKLGVRAGTPDICAVHNGRFYALEIKAPGGRATVVQLDAIAAINRVGGFAAIVCGLNEALRCLECWGLLK